MFAESMFRSLRALAVAIGAAHLLLAVQPLAPLGKYTAAERRHWAFQKRSQPAFPAFTDPKDAVWAKTPIDAFVLARMKKENFTPAPPADRATLIRRLSFDLTGLPPSPREISAFVGDRSPQAWEHLVERMLASPHYGERWGQHWLDVVRYADTDGFEYDTHRFDSWRYRDYVIRAFNNDKPYDRFIAEQLAGDEIAPQEDETLIAAGFNRLGPLRKNAGNQEVSSSRNEVLTEMTNIVGSALLGVTLGCARCHDHKFDPFRQSDYYRMQAFFAPVYPNDVNKASEEEKAAWKAKADPIQAEIAALRKAIKANKSGEGLTELSKKLEDAEDSLPHPLPALYSVSDDPAKKTEIHLLQRGDYQNRGDRVGMRPIGVLLPPDAPELPEDTAKPRAELAKWITDPENPLTARVMVNRIWQYHFGRGIVATPNDFGRMGERASNPELLDYLANEFVARGFSVKHIHRLILMSSTYRQSSAADAASKKNDPDDKFLAHYPRRRLDAEEIRDSMLSIAGRLNPKEGGPGVITPIEPSLVKALYKPSQWVVATDPAEFDRRSVYLLAKRNLRLPFMEVFDSPDLQVSCPRRQSSTHAPQALEMLNGASSNEAAKAFAQRLLKEGGHRPRKQVELAYKLAMGRVPKPQEMKLALQFLKVNPEAAALDQFALAMFNLNGFLYVN